MAANLAPPNFAIFSSYASAACACVIAVIIGLIMGSHLNCLAWRISHKQSVVCGRSHCISCGHTAAARELVPLFSWLFLGGRCRFCGERISARYLAAEIVCALVYGSIVWSYGLTLEALELLAFASVLFVLTLTDLDSLIIPNACIGAAVAIRLAYLVAAAALGQLQLGPALMESLIGMLAIALPLLLLVLIMDRVLGQPSMGGGDIKLFAVAGFYFGWQQCLFLLLLSCVLGIVYSCATALAGSNNMQVSTAHNFPFGPAIAVSSWLTMLVGSQLIGWYLRILF